MGEKDGWVVENFDKQPVRWGVLPWIGCWNTPRYLFPNSANTGFGVEAFQHMDFFFHLERMHPRCNCCKYPC